MKVDGLLLLDKPLGLSSNAALQRARRFLDASKAGHGGTLDPMATGLLPIMFGEACKLAERSLEGDKGYLATVCLGVRTTTDDVEGEVIETREPLHEGRPIDLATIESALQGFRGPIVQVPPVFSALKVGGVPMYKRARRGEVLAPQARPVVIHELVVEAWTSPSLRIRVRCSKGTYIRALARDIGAVLGCGAHLSALRRTRVGRFDVRDSIGLESLAALDSPIRTARLVGLEALVEGWPTVELTLDAAARFVQGQSVPMPDESRAGSADDIAGGERIAVFSRGRLLGLGRAQHPLLPISPEAASSDSAMSFSASRSASVQAGATAAKVPPRVLLAPSRIISE